MKKTALAALASGILLLGMMGNAMANTIYNYEDVYIPGTNYKLIKNDQSFESKSWTFNITDDSDWNNPHNQVFNNGKIVLVLEDDGDSAADKATFTYEITGIASDNQFISTYNLFSFIVDPSAIDDGLISATLTASVGDFYFRSATFTVTSEVMPPPHVPEPSTVVLLGSGLLGLFYVGRRKIRK